MLKYIFKDRFSFFDIAMISLTIGLVRDENFGVAFATFIAWAGAATFAGTFYRALDEADSTTPPKGETE